jgi:hypothetical protein
MREVARAIALSATLTPCRGNAAARPEAAALARNLKRGAAMPDCDWLVANVDQHGRKVDEVPITDA